MVLKDNISKNIFKILLLSLVLGFIIFTVFFTVLLKDNLEDNITTQLEQDAQIMTEVVNTYFTKYDEVVRQMSINPLLTDYIKELDNYNKYKQDENGDNISLVLSNIENSDHHISIAWLGICSFNGIIISDREYEIFEDYDIESRPWFKDMINNEGKVTHSQPYIDMITGNYIISIVAPVKLGDDIVGNVGIDINIGDITEYIESYHVENQGYTFLLDNFGDYIVYPEFADSGIRNIDDGSKDFLEIGKHMISGVKKIEDYRYNDINYYVAYSPVPVNNWSVACVVPKDNLRKQLIMLYIMSIGIIITSILIFFIFYLNYRKNKYIKTLKNLNIEINEYNNKLKKKDEYIENLVYLDPLTGIANRRKFTQYLEEALADNNKGGVALLDLDNFKEINDTKGHIYGDKLLEMIAARMSVFEKNQNIKVSRFGGDEFLILFNNMISIGEIKKHAEKIVKDLSEKIHIGSEDILMGMSMGISRFPEDSMVANQLIMNADIAMYNVKNTGKNRYTFFDGTMTEEIITRKNAEDILKEAVINDDFYMMYQPKIAVDSCTIDGYEALIRMGNNKLYPDEFIRISEENGSIITIGRWIINEVLKDMSLWREKGMRLRPVSINFSPKQIEDKNFLQYLDEILRKYDIEEKYIEIEITETAIMENKKEALSLLNSFKEKGIGLSLDDFGTGYSSLSYLTFLPVDKIKLDKTMCDRYLEKEFLKVIENLIEISHTLGMKVVAEGIEHKEQFDFLREIGCDYIQGYIFSRPIFSYDVINVNEKNYKNV